MSESTGAAIRARHLAERLHAGQVDKQGAPYIRHLEAVAGLVVRCWPHAPAEAIEAAWLHDAMEDAGATEESLRAEGISPGAIALVRELSRPEGRPYRAWIWDLAITGSDWAIRVKLADKAHNSDPARRVPGSDIVERRYEPARQVLEAALHTSDPPKNAHRRLCRRRRRHRRPRVLGSGTDISTGAAPRPATPC